RCNTEGLSKKEPICSMYGVNGLEKSVVLWRVESSSTRMLSGDDTPMVRNTKAALAWAAKPLSLDHLKAWAMTGVPSGKATPCFSRMVQVRPSADTSYPSRYGPSRTVVSTKK